MQVRASAQSQAAQRASHSRKADSGVENQISELEKQKKELEVKLKKVRSDPDLDNDAKKVMAEALQKKIQTITQTIQDLRRQQAEQRKQKAEGGDEEQKQETSPFAQRRGDEFVRSRRDASSMQQAISADQLRTMTSSTQSLQAALNGRANVLASEVKLDGSYGIDSAKKMEEICDLRDGARNVMQAAIEQAAPFTKNTASPIHAGALHKPPPGDSQEEEPEKEQRLLTYDKQGSPVYEDSKKPGSRLNQIA